MPFLIALAFASTLALNYRAALPVSNPSSQASQATAPASSISGDYLLDEGDTLAVYVYNHTELSGSFFVPSGGVVQFPVIGNVRVSGKTLDQVSAALNRAYQRELIRPQVTVSVSVPRIQQATVMGDVQKPGAIPVIPGTTLASAVSAAGGLNPNLKPSETIVTLLPQNGKPTSYPLTAILEGAPESNLQIHGGDTVQVDSGTITVYVVGQAKQPGIQTLTRNTGLLQAIASAGGPTDTASISQVRLTRVDGTDQVFDLTPTLVHGQNQTLPQLRKGDLITIPLDTNQISILGYVQLPGTYTIPDGLTYHLSDAVSLAHGQDSQKRGSFSKVVVARLVNGKPEHFVYDFGKFLKKGDVTQNPLLQANDLVYVPETNSIPTQSFLTALATSGLLYYYVGK